jgi:hypothetical protein
MAMPCQPKDSLYAFVGNATEYRLRTQRAAEERVALRTSELAAQASLANDPEERIRIWERLHAVRLPQSSRHVLVKVIATQTRLTIGQVHAEQMRRATGVAPTEALPPEACIISASKPPQAEHPPSG